MSLTVPTVAEDLVHPAGASSTQTAVSTVTGYVDDLTVTVGGVSATVSANKAESDTAHGKAEDVRLAMVELLTQVQSILPVLIERLKPLPDTTPLMDAVDACLTALEAAAP